MSDDFKAQVRKEISSYSRPKLQRLALALANNMISAGYSTTLYDMITMLRVENSHKIRCVLPNGRTVTVTELIMLRDSDALTNMDQIIRSCRDPDKTPTTEEVAIMAASYLKRGKPLDKTHVGKLLTIAGFVSASTWRIDLGRVKHCWVNTEKTRDIPTDELASLVRANIEKMIIRVLAGREEDELPS